MKTSRALARDFSLRAERVNNVGRVGPRSVLYLLFTLSARSEKSRASALDVFTYAPRG